MNLIADILLAAGAVGAAIYCFVLSKRLNKFNSLEQGVGGAVAVLSKQVEDLKETLSAAQETAGTSATALTDLSSRAEDISQRLELQLASLHDLPEGSWDQSSTNAETNDSWKAATATQEPAKSAPSSEPMFIRHAAGASN